jgi:nondiscriminating aspartyl-tRNA synthetase
MERIPTAEVGAKAGQRVRVAGWLHSQRRLGGVTFVVIRDGSGLIQAVAEGEDALTPVTLSSAGLESIVEVEGTATPAPQAPGGIELREPAITVLVPVHAVPPVPLHKREIKANLVTQLDHAVVVNRHPTRRAMLRLSAGLMAGFRASLSARGFTEIQTPHIVAAATESGANVFQLDYFGRPAFLSQSPQFYKQIMVGVFERVFEVGPVFRAEPHDTTRHLNEYTSLDVEFGFIESHFTVMALLGDLVAEMLDTLRDRYRTELDLLRVQLPLVPPTIPHIHFADAQELILRRHGLDVRGEPDLSPQDERWLGAWAQQEHASDFLYVTGYPMSKRPFYTHPDPERPGFSNSFDLLFRGAEMVTGGQRLHRYEDYLAALAAAHLPTEPFASYLDAFRYGMPPHGGFGMGLERLLMQLTGAPSIKLAATFPRDLHRLEP